MYAIIETGGKQYRVSEGDIVTIEKLESQDPVTFEKVLMITDGDKVTCGNPFIGSASVTADIVGHGKGEKVLVFKQKVRKNHRKLRGHRQQYTSVKIKSIQVS
ncbi:MAG: 50S ribosomal protein L21 [Nitrospiraceae bacterium]|nr:MAG: 50S ribosomal protein L21 [Nitrospiraceae bacterium]